jgi:hypothetical protein
MTGASVEERGTAFVLLGVVVIVVIWLAAVAVDASSVFLAHRELSNLAQAAANDAVSGIDEESYFGQGEYVVEVGRGARAERLLERAVAASGLAEQTRFRTLESELTREGPTRVTVTLRATVHRPMLGGIPGMERDTTLTVRASAEAVVDDAPPEP